MFVRNEKYTEDGIVYYRMQRGDYRVLVAAVPAELEQGRSVIARRLILARQMLNRMVVLGAYRQGPP